MHYMYIISMKGRYFGNIPVEADLKLIVVETCAYNSAEVMIQAIRGANWLLTGIFLVHLRAFLHIALSILLYRCHFQSTAIS